MNVFLVMQFVIGKSEYLILGYFTKASVLFKLLLEQTVLILSCWFNK